MTQVFVAKHPTEAHLVAEFLEAEGIPAEIRGEALFGVRGDVPPSPATLPTVWVENDRADEARQILATTNGQGPAGAHRPAPWPCPACGESVDAHFAACWNCGTPAPNSLA